MHGKNIHILIGCGKMGGAMLSRQSQYLPNDEFLVFDPHADFSGFHNPNITSSNDFQEFKAKIVEISAQKRFHFASITIAVKPQIIEQISTDIANIFSSLDLEKQPVVISLAAGVTTKRLQQYFSRESSREFPVVRLMPNTPAMVGKGAIVAFADENARKIANINQMLKDLLDVSGKLYIINDESLMDTVTALSGSGPAYIFLLCEILAKNGEKLGLSSELSKDLARQTIIGSAALLEHEQNVPASQLRENVTSPNGTTAAALEILMNGELERIIELAMSKAKQRSKELGS